MTRTELAEMCSKIGDVCRDQLAGSGVNFVLIMQSDETNSSTLSSNMKPAHLYPLLQSALEAYSKRD